MEKEQNWYFTFGVVQAYSKRFVKIYGSSNAAREEMFLRFGPNWAFQYNEEEFLPQIEEYGLKELV